MRPEVSVAIGVVIPDDVGLSYNQVLNDAIRIGLKKGNNIHNFSDVHFLQFITHQCPDEFDYNRNKTIRWDDQETNYMMDLTTPRWRVDSASWPDPFYEIGGAHKEENEWLYIYDQPGYALGENERAVGCTFLIAKNRVFKEVRWSRQKELIAKRLQSTYHYTVHDVEQLPEWALHVLLDNYRSNDYDSKSNKMVYAIPAVLQRNLQKSPQEALKKARRSILPAPNNWVVYSDSIFNVLVKIPMSDLAMQKFMELETEIENYSLLAKRVQNGMFAGQLPRDLREIQRIFHQIKEGVYTMKEGLRAMISVATNMGGKHPILIKARRCDALVNRFTLAPSSIFSI